MLTSSQANGDAVRVSGDAIQVNGDAIHPLNGDAKFKFVGIGCDVSSELDVQNTFARVLEMFGRLDAVVANAGGCISSHHSSSIAHGTGHGM